MSGITKKIIHYGEHSFRKETKLFCNSKNLESKLGEACFKPFEAASASVKHDILIQSRDGIRSEANQSARKKIALVEVSATFGMIGSRVT